MNPVFLIFGMGGQEIFFVFIIVLLLFGGNKIPELMRGLGRGVREFNSAKATMEDEIRKGMDDAEKKKESETEMRMKIEAEVRERIAKESAAKSV